MPAPVRVDVCICTFRRTYLAETLRSVAANATSLVDLRVIVADNDTVPSAQLMTEAFAHQAPFPVRYMHVPAQNISLARNACLDATSAEFVAFIDDDEHVGPEWLAALLLTARATGADVVLGPVFAEYGSDAPDWMREGDFHSTRPAYVDGVIKTGYTCNALMRRSEPFKAMRFDLSLGRSGGEDTEFFYRLHDLGGRIAFASEAVVYEPVPPERARFGWLMRRRYRSGQTHGMRLVRASRGGVGAITLAGAKSAYCLLMTGLNAFSPIRRRRHLLRAALHFGAVGGLLRTRQADLYGHDAGAQSAPQRTPGARNEVVAAAPRAAGSRLRQHEDGLRQDRERNGAV